MRTEKSCFTKIILIMGIVVCVFAGILYSVNAPAVDLFSEVSNKDQPLPLDDPLCIRSRLVTLNIEPLCVLQAAGQDNTTLEYPVSLNLFNDVYLIAKIKEVRRTFSRGYSYVGTIDGEPDSEVKLVLHGNMLIGNINIPGHSYQVRYVSDGLFKVQEIDQSRFPSELPPVPVHTTAKDFQPSLPDSADTIDILVVYTAAACLAAKGTIAMEALFDLAIDESNEGFNNSDVNHRFRLVHTAEVVYSEKGFNWETALDRLQITNDNYMDGVHQLRDTYGADVVVLIVDNQDYCGIAFLMTQPSSGFESWAFAVVNWECATGYYTFAHEIGHNMGSHHDRANAQGSGFYPYSYGYQAPDLSFRTIMAYDCNPSCPRVNYWSNPQIKYSGQPMGVDSSSPLAADNHQSLNKTALTVANFRQQSIASTLTITSPNGGENWLAGSTQDITWIFSGHSGNVKIDYSINNGASWSTIISSTPNNGTYSWILPEVDSATCLVRIQEASSGLPSDVSNSVFSIYKSGTPSSVYLDKARLNYTAIVNGPQTGEQYIWVSNTGGGILNWTIQIDASWLTCNPVSGNGGGLVTVSVNPSGLVQGNYLANIKVSDTSVANSSQTVVVSLSVKGGASDVPPFGSFDTPIHGSTVMSSIPVTGWVLDDVEVSSMKIYNGNSYIGEAVFVDGARPDVEQAYPGYPKNYRAGWGYMLLTNFLPNGGNGSYTLHAKASDSRGHETLLGTKVINIQNNSAVKPFGAIDTPAQGGYVQGGNYVNWGWVLTPQPNSIPTDGSTINVLVDGVNLGHPVYNNYRKDIASFFPGYANSNGAVGYFYIDTTTLQNGVHTIQWTATDSSGNTDGIGSRYFTVNNSSSDASISKAMGYGRGVIEDLSNVTLEDTKPIFYKKGYHQKEIVKKIYPWKDGISRIYIKELESLKVHLTDHPNKSPSEGNNNPSSKSKGSCYLKGYLVVGGELRSLLPGCFLDTKKGIFYWLPGPGILGQYRFLFLKKDNQGVFTQKGISITVLPKFTLTADKGKN